MEYKYKADVYRVVDGDTFYASVDLGFTVSVDVKFRLAGIDTSEIFRPKSEEERTHGLLAKDRVSELILNKRIIVISHKTGKYGRWIGEVILDDTTLTQILIDEGFEKLKQEK